MKFLYFFLLVVLACIPALAEYGGGGVGGVTQLTGDCTAGPGSGSQVMTCTQAGGGTGTYTAGNFVAPSASHTIAAYGSGSNQQGMTFDTNGDTIVRPSSGNNKVDVDSHNTTLFGGLLAAASNDYIGADSSNGNLAAGQAFFQFLGLVTGGGGNISQFDMTNSVSEFLSTTQIAYPCPAMTATQMSAITPAHSGACAYNTTAGAPYQYVGSAWKAVSAALKAPTVQRFTSGTGTYTTPTNPSPLYIRVELVGGGGGGGSSGTGSFGSPGAGGTTTFGTSLLTATGGAAGSEGGNPAGGTVTIGSGPVVEFSSAGASSGSSQIQNGSPVPVLSGGSGGASYFGGAGGGGSLNGGGAAAIANTGSGGGGGAGSTAVSGLTTGTGGGAGGYIRALISGGTLGSSFSYGVGAAGAGGTAGTNGAAGGNGAAGVITVTEFYQ